MKLTAFFDRIIARTRFPETRDVNFELKKVALVRILVGIIAFIRYFQTYAAVSMFQEIRPLELLIVLTCIFLFTIGFFTPFFTAALLFLSIHADLTFGTSTLGTTVFCETLIVFLLTNAGNFYSVDRFIFKKKIPLLKDLLALTYGAMGKMTVVSLRRAYFWGFTLYALSSLTALVLHISDPYWMHGLTTKALLTSSYLCPRWEFFRGLEEASPALISIVSISGSIFQSIFQFGMPLLIFSKWGARYVFVWGLIFFLISFFLISLSYLPHLEILLWLLIFVPVRVDKKRVSILYDDHCNLCKKTTRILKLLNFNASVDFLALSTNAHRVEKYKLTEKQIKAYMTGFVEDKVYIGYDLYIQIVLRNPLYWILLPLFILGKITRLGPMMYNWIAENRYRIFGTCELSFEDELKREDVQISGNEKYVWRDLLYVSFFFATIVFLIAKMPYVERVVSDEMKHRLNPWFKGLGLERPDVFNRVDLTMGDSWMEIYRVEEGREVLTPIIGAHGERLNYAGHDYFLFKNHNTDFLYFGSTLSFARGFVNITDKEKAKEYVQSGYGNRSLLKRIKYDYLRMKLKGKVRYRIVLVKTSGSQVTNFESTPERFTKNILQDFYVSFDGNKLSYDTDENSIQ